MPPPEEGAARSAPNIAPVEDKSQAQRLQRFLRWITIAIFCFVPLDLGVYYAYGDARSLLMAFGTGSIAIVFLWAHRELGHGNVRTGVIATALAFLLPTALLVFVRPQLFPVLAVGPLLAVALPLARGRVLTGLVWAAWATGAFIIVAGTLLRPTILSEVPRGIELATFDAALAIVLALALLMLWQFGARLHTALTETRTAVVQLNRSNEELHQLDSLKSQFMNNAAHELNTPLTPIRLQIHLLRSLPPGRLPGDTQQSVEILHRNVERLTGLVRDVLDASRVQGGRLKLVPAPVDLRDALQETFNSYRDPAAASGVQLTLDAPQPLPVDADERRLTQVLFNLVSNALKYTPRDGRISIRGRADDAEVRVEVRDTGVGFTPEEREKLFRPFSQLHLSSSAPASGTGLGLYIVKGVVDEHGGRVWAISEGHGRGSTFGFAVPLRKPKRETPALAEARPALVEVARPMDARERRLRELI